MPFSCQVQPKEIKDNGFHSVQPTDEQVSFRGTQSGLEIRIPSSARYEAILLTLIEKLETSSSFFRGARVTIRFSEDPIPGIFADIETIALKYELTIVSMRSRGDDTKLSKSSLNLVQDETIESSEEDTGVPPKLADLVAHFQRD